MSPCGIGHVDIGLLRSDITLTSAWYARLVPGLAASPAWRSVPSYRRRPSLLRAWSRDSGDGDEARRARGMSADGLYLATQHGGFYDPDIAHP
jgi:hypothetical protein